MEANQEVKLMQEDSLEQLKALAKLMIVSMVWHGADLDSDKARNNQENTNPEKNRDSDNQNQS